MRIVGRINTGACNRRGLLLLVGAADRMRARAVNMDNRIVNLDGNMLVRKAFGELEFDVQV